MVSSSAPPISAGPQGIPGQGIWTPLMALILGFGPWVNAQDNATITGTATDVSGALVPNVAITLLNPATGSNLLPQIFPRQSPN